MIYITIAAMTAALLAMVACIMTNAKIKDMQDSLSDKDADIDKRMLDILDCVSNNSKRIHDHISTDLSGRAFAEAQKATSYALDAKNAIEGYVGDDGRVTLDVVAAFARISAIEGNVRMLTECMKLTTSQRADITEMAASGRRWGDIALELGVSEPVCKWYYTNIGRGLSC